MSEREACRACPWRIENQGKRTPGGWYSRANLDRLWAGLRRGAQMSCHPTDPRMQELSDDGPAGFRAAPDGTVPKVCVGGEIVVQREYMLLQEDHRADLAAYRRSRPRGLTRDGIVALIERHIFGGTSTPAPKPNLNDASVGHPRLPWEAH